MSLSIDTASDMLAGAAPYAQFFVDQLADGKGRARCISKDHRLPTFRTSTSASPEAALKRIRAYLEENKQ